MASAHSYSVATGKLLLAWQPQDVVEEVLRAFVLTGVGAAIKCASGSFLGLYAQTSGICPISRRRQQRAEFLAWAPRHTRPRLFQRPSIF